MSSEGWIERSGTMYGAPARWRERAKPGHPGVVERVYVTAPERESEPLPNSCGFVGTPAHAAAVRDRSQTVIPATPTYSATPALPLYAMAGDPASDVMIRERSQSAPATRKGAIAPFVHVTANAHRALLAFELSDDAENDGGLLGRRDGSAFIVEEVCGNGGRDRGRSYMYIDPEFLEERARARHLDVIGTWHSHPSRGKGKPSPGDLQVWDGWLAADAPVHMILMRSNDWLGKQRAWKFHSYLVSRNGDERHHESIDLQCEPHWSLGNAGAIVPPRVRKPAWLAA